MLYYSNEKKVIRSYEEIYLDFDKNEQSFLIPSILAH